MGKILNLTYSSALKDICDLNSSFDMGILQIAYPGLNRNGSFISKESFERCIKTMYNCPLVCNYDRETDSFGGHDVDVVKDSDGNYKLVNLTTPIGCVPESAKYWWDKVVDDDGVEREYLFTNVLLWKRQEAYKKLKEDGVSAQSMELHVKDGEVIDNTYYIYDFEFTAFALIGVTPCFEGASVEVFSKEDFKAQLSEMMADLKKSFGLVDTSKEGNINQHKDNLTEGGKTALEEKTALIREYGFEPEDLDFSYDEITIDELKAKLEEKKTFSEEGENNLEDEMSGEPETEPTGDTGEASGDDQSGTDDEEPAADGDPEDDDDPDNFALNRVMVSEVIRKVTEPTRNCEWGEIPCYYYEDCDFDKSEVYCWDTEDWLLYGFTFSIDGDAVTINFDTKKRVKYVIEDFEGSSDEASPIAGIFEIISKKISEDAETISSLTAKVKDHDDFKNELCELRKFKLDSEFSDLLGDESYSEIRDNCMEYDLQTLEEKCYAIRGRNSGRADFTLTGKTSKLIVDRSDLKFGKDDDENDDNEPYGGIVKKYNK